jgi:uroporphyrinogen-III synthase
MEPAALSGWTVGVTADRRREEQAELLARRGARVVHGPTIHTLPVELDDGLEQAIERVVAEPPDIVVLHTAVGTRAWLAAAESLGRGEALLAVLRTTTVIARGPKAAGAAVTAGFDVHWSAPGETSAEIVVHLREVGVTGRRVVVQRDGAPVAHLAAALAAEGADVVDVPVYRWQAPADPGPAARLAEATADQRVDAVTFTSSPGLEGFLAAAAGAGVAAEVLDALNGPVVAACVGPVCAATAIREGITHPVVPHRSRLGAMVQALVREAGERKRVTRVGPVAVLLQGALVVVGDREIDLPVRERRLLGVLAERPGVVVAKAELLRRAWNTSPDPHAVEVAVGRLRKRLAPTGLGIEAVPRRGYRLVA